MLNPYVLLTPELLNAMLKQPLYFVRQYYQRGENNFDNTNKIPILLTHYSHHEIDSERAKRHMRLLWNDRLRFLYDSNNNEHLEKLKIAATQPRGYKIYTNVLVKDWVSPKHIKSKLYYYLTKTLHVDSKLTNENVRIHLKDLFGKLYLIVSWKGTKVEVLLDEIENIYSYVL